MVWSADVTMTVNPPIISLGETAQLTVEVRNAKQPGAPNFPNVEGLRFSGTSHSSNMSMINGQVDRSVSYTTTIHPQRTGEFLIGPFNYPVDGKTKQLSGTLKVVTSSGNTTAAQSWNDLVFAKLTSNRQRAYVQEPFELTLAVYTRSGLKVQGVQNLRGLPETGLTTEQDWQGTAPSREQINGELYDVQRFKATMRAVGSGTFTFAPTITVQVVAPQQHQRRRDPFDSFFNRVQTIPVDVKASETLVEVFSLPTIGKPEHFSGAVGRFQFAVSANPKEVSPGDPITLEMTVTGTGNLDRILPPTLPADTPFRLFGDAVRKQTNRGVRFEQVISPRNASVSEIPPIRFSFFDSETAQYRTLLSQPIPITVTASSNNTAQLFVAKDAVTVAPSNVPFASESDLQRMSKWLRQQWRTIRPWLWTLPAALGIGLLLFGIQKFIHWKRNDVAWMRRQEAPKAARKALKAADSALTKGDTAAFYEALGNALNQYFGNRLNLSPGNVTPNAVLIALSQADAETETTRQLFEQTEAARYGLLQPEPSMDALKAIRRDVGRLLRAMERIKL